MGIRVVMSSRGIGKSYSNANYIINYFMKSKTLKRKLKINGIYAEARKIR